MKNNNNHMNKCKRCGKLAEESEFITSWNKISKRCKKCRDDRNGWAKAYYKRWSKVVKKDNKEYYHQNRAKFKTQRRNNTLKRKYGIDIEIYEKMFENQKGNCALCGQTMVSSSKKGWGGKLEPCIDHDHQTGKVRGILHRGCNLSLSMIEDKTFISQATQYLASQRSKG